MRRYPHVQVEACRSMPQHKKFFQGTAHACSQARVADGQQAVAVADAPGRAPLLRHGQREEGLARVPPQLQLRADLVLRQGLAQRGRVRPGPGPPPPPHPAPRQPAHPRRPHHNHYCMHCRFVKHYWSSALVAASPPSTPECSPSPPGTGMGRLLAEMPPLFYELCPSARWHRSP